MKKVLMFAAVALCAALSQAVSVSWTASNITTDGATKIPKGTMTGYLFDASASLDDVLDAINAGGDALSALQIGAKATSALDGVVSGASTIVSETKYPAGSSQTFYAVIIDTATGKYIQTATKTVLMKAIGGTTVGFGSQIANYGWKDVAPVPEPTAVALIALGLAAVGLKRKVA